MTTEAKMKIAAKVIADLMIHSPVTTDMVEIIRDSNKCLDELGFLLKDADHFYDRINRMSITEQGVFDELYKQIYE